MVVAIHNYNVLVARSAQCIGVFYIQTHEPASECVCDCESSFVYCAVCVCAVLYQRRRRRSRWIWEEERASKSKTNLNGMHMSEKCDWISICCCSNLPSVTTRMRKFSFHTSSECVTFCPIFSYTTAIHLSLSSLYVYMCVRHRKSDLIVHYSVEKYRFGKTNYKTHSHLDEMRGNEKKKQ